MKVYGPGVEKTGLKSNEPTYFTVDCVEAGQGLLTEIPKGFLYSLAFIWLTIVNHSPR